MVRYNGLVWSNIAVLNFSHPIYMILAFSAEFMAEMIMTFVDSAIEAFLVDKSNLSSPFYTEPVGEQTDVVLRFVDLV